MRGFQGQEHHGRAACNRVAVALALIAGLTAGPLGAQEFIEPSALELAGHHALHRVIAETDEALDAFETDGCSGGLSSGWRVVADEFPEFADAHGATPPWERCCIDHDRAYHLGGREATPREGFDARLAADHAFRACIIESGTTRVSEMAARYETTEEQVKRGYRAMGEAMFLAVRFGGGPCSGLPWRWGYGSAQCFVTPQDFREGEE